MTSLGQRTDGQIYHVQNFRKLQIMIASILKVAGRNIKKNKDNRSDCANHRGIWQLTVRYQNFAKILYGRLSRYCEQVLRA